MCERLRGKSTTDMANKDSAFNVISRNPLVDISNSARSGSYCDAPDLDNDIIIIDKENDFVPDSVSAPPSRSRLHRSRIQSVEMIFYVFTFFHYVWHTNFLHYNLYCSFIVIVFDDILQY